MLKDELHNKKKFAIFSPHHILASSYLLPQESEQRVQFLVQQLADATSNNNQAHQQNATKYLVTCWLYPEEYNIYLLSE